MVMKFLACVPLELMLKLRERVHAVRRYEHNI